ncbi:MAG: type VI secretion system lipoprotein TssJ [bacterium]
MKKSFIALFLIVITIMTCCARKRKAATTSTPPRQYVAPAPPEWRYEKEAIQLRIKADPQLNLFQKTSHTVVLCIYQLSSPNAFQELAETEEGLSRLIECSRFDASVASSRNVVVQPGHDMTKSLDRAEGAQYIAVVAGYYLLRKEMVTRLFQVPVIEETVDSSGLKRLKPGPMTVDLFLGPHGIQEAGNTQETGSTQETSGTQETGATQGMGGK